MNNNDIDEQKTFNQSMIAAENFILFPSLSWNVPLLLST